MAISLVLTQILDNLVKIAQHVTTIMDVNDLDRALAALETRFDVTKDQAEVVHAAFTRAQDRINRAKRPVIDDLTKFMVVRRSLGTNLWAAYLEPTSWEIAYSQCEEARKTCTGEFKIVVWL